MAYAASYLYKTVMGDKRVHALTCTADAASGIVVTGLRLIDSVAIAVASCDSIAFTAYINTAGDSSSTANGTLFVSTATSGDGFTIVCTGS